MLLETLSTSFRKARSVNQTSSSFASRVPVNAEPDGDAGTATGACVFSLSGDATVKGIVAQNDLIVVPYATGTDGETFSVRVLGWRGVGLAAPATQLWVPVLLAQLACTISSTVHGLAGMAVLDTELFSDTLVLTYGNEGSSADVVSNGGNLIAHAMIDLKGFQKLELTFSTGGSVTDCNALVALL